MLGTKLLEQNLSEIRYQKSCEITKLLRQMGYWHRKRICSSYELKYHREDRRKLKYCVELSKQFRSVAIDEKIERRIKTTGGEVITCPLVFSANLPLKNITTKRVKGKNGKEYELKTRTPLPTKEALDAIKYHKHRFEQLALWWVPNEITVDEVKELDPILVGKIETRLYGNICFELHRWVDENFEAEYWAKEGY